MSAKLVDLAALARDLASRSVGEEANVQAHIQTILLFGGLNLAEENLETVELEAQAGGGRRIAHRGGLHRHREQALAAAGVAQQIDEIVVRLGTPNVSLTTSDGALDVG